jgi:hypothetical protein
MLDRQDDARTSLALALEHFDVVGQEHPEARAARNMAGPR